MFFVEIVKQKKLEYDMKQDRGDKLTDYEKGFIDALLLAAPYATDEPKTMVVYRDRIVEKIKTEYKTIAIERPVIRKQTEYASRNTVKEYCFYLAELSDSLLEKSLFVFITKKQWHEYLHFKGILLTEARTIYGNEPISLETLADFTKYIRSIT